MAFFGELPGCPKGSFFASRKSLSQTDVHRHRVAGICGSAKEGAESVVLAGAYEDDEDRGDIILYTGAGARDPKTGRQLRDQTLTRGNLALANSKIYGRPVRVIRRVGDGYRYDGLYFVGSFWQEPGQAGFLVWRFKLVRA
ncbi:MAG: YDG/SRA domain-containing protein [Rhodothermales bacterium]